MPVSNVVSVYLEQVILDKDFEFFLSSFLVHLGNTTNIACALLVKFQKHSFAYHKEEMFVKHLFV